MSTQVIDDKLMKEIEACIRDWFVGLEKGQTNLTDNIYHLIQRKCVETAMAQSEQPCIKCGHQGPLNDDEPLYGGEGGLN